MARASNRDRIAHAAAEASAAAAEKTKLAAEKAAGKPVKKPAAPRVKRVAAPVREKIVWEVYGSSGTTLKTFAYPDKVAAEAHVVALTSSTTGRYGLRGTRVSMT